MSSATPASVPSTRWAEITAIWRDNRWLFALSGWFLGILTIVALQRLHTDISSLLVDLVPEAVGIVFTVLILERFAANRAIQERKLALFRQGKSRSNDVALEAVDQILHEGWWDELLEHYLDENGQVDLFSVHWSGGIRLPEVHLENAFLQDAHLENAFLWKAHLENANLVDAHLENADLRFAHLENANLGLAHLDNANLGSTYLDNAYLGFAHLDNADLGSTYLDNADLGAAHLENAFLVAAHLDNANLYKAHLENADLRDASLRGVRDIETAFFNEKTVLPDAIHLGFDNNGNEIFDKYWTPDTDMTRYTNPDHPDFWEPNWVKAEREQQEKQLG